MNFAPFIALLVLGSIGWLVLGIGVGMLIGRAANLPHGRDTYRQAQSPPRAINLSAGLGVALNTSTNTQNKAEGEYDFHNQQVRHPES